MIVLRRTSNRPITPFVSMRLATPTTSRPPLSRQQCQLMLLLQFSEIQMYDCWMKIFDATALDWVLSALFGCIIFTIAHEPTIASGSTFEPVLEVDDHD